MVQHMLSLICRSCCAFLLGANGPDFLVEYEMVFSCCIFGFGNILIDILACASDLREAEESMCWKIYG